MNSITLMMKTGLIGRRNDGAVRDRACDNAL